MFNKYMVLTRDFRNTGPANGAFTGFQMKIRIPYYRGARLSLVESIDLTVDGIAYPSDQLSFAIGGRSFSMSEMEKATDVEWPFDQPATLTANKPGGLASGMHVVQLGIVIRKSYIPKNDPENLFDFAGDIASFLHASERTTRKITLV